MDKSRGMARNGRWLGGQLKERPSEVFKKHVRVVPYPEDDTVGPSRSSAPRRCSWVRTGRTPRLREPADFYDRVEGLGDETRRLFLRENGMNLVAGT